MRLLIAFAAVTFTALAASAQTITLGILEDLPGAYFRKENYPAVRVVFCKKGADWVVYTNACAEGESSKGTPPKYPNHVEWTIGFDGRVIGHVSTGAPSDSTFSSHIGLRDVLSPGSAPRVGKRSAQYSGFPGDEVYRPLVANSQPYVSDPDNWKVAPAPTEIRGALRNGFRREFPKLCRWIKGDNSKQVPFAYRDEAVTVVKAYRSRAGVWLARLHLTDAMYCDDNFGMSDSWFVVMPNHTAKFLDEGIWLVDAGDYDNDGKSEVIFSIDQYNKGGYILFYSDFSKRVEFGFSFH